MGFFFVEILLKEAICETTSSPDSDVISPERQTIPQIIPWKFTLKLVSLSLRNNLKGWGNKRKAFLCNNKIIHPEKFCFRKFNPIKSLIFISGKELYLLPYFTSYFKNCRFQAWKGNASSFLSTCTSTWACLLCPLLYPHEASEFRILANVSKIIPNCKRKSR